MDYYRIAQQASQEIGNHSGLTYLKSACETAPRIIDVGCGEGTRLNTLLPAGKKGWGIDPSPKAIALAKKHYSHHSFRLGVGESLPYPDASFDLVYSAFAIEHCSDPEKFISELIRVCKTGGRVVILAPNYGAPNRRSPNSTEYPLTKFFEGLLKDFFPHPRLDWQRVTPQSGYRRIDADTTWEPYVLSLTRFFEHHHLKIAQTASLWNLEPKTTSPRKLISTLLGRLGIFPFCHWGPQVFVAGVKQL